MGLKRTREELGPNPDPERWIDIKTKEGWLRRRKPKKKPKLNAVMQEHADAAKLTMPAANRLLGKLEPWVRGLDLGRVRAKMAARLKKSYFETGKMNFTYLLDMDIQPDRTMKALLIPRPKVFLTDELVVKILILEETLRIKRSIFTDFYFELIMLWGDVMKEGSLRVIDVESKLYPRLTEVSGECVLKIDVPPTKEPWMALLKVNCLEGKELAHNPRHYALKVIAVSG
jgi:hypothetical protein